MCLVKFLIFDYPLGISIYNTSTFVITIAHITNLLHISTPKHYKNYYTFTETLIYPTLTVDADRARVDRLSQFVGGFTHVGTRVLRVRVQDVQRHVPEVVRCPEPNGTGGNVLL